MQFSHRLSLGFYWYGTALLLLPGRVLGASDLGGVGAIPGAGGKSAEELKAQIVKFVNVVLNFLALIAVIFIIVAGIRLIVSQGDDGEKDKAKKTIIYVVVGLIVVLLAKVIVNFAISLPQ